MTKKAIIVIALLSIFFSQIRAQSIDHKVFLLGNLPDIHNKTSFSDRFVTLLKSTNEPYTIIINGDLIDDDPTKENTKEIKDFLTKISQNSKGKIIIIPGDRDWDNSGEDGWDNVKKLEKIVKDWDLKNVKWPNDDACPGPKDEELSSNLLLVTVDTQWWNHPYRKPTPADADCKVTTMMDYLDEFKEVIEENQNKNILIAGHFPLISEGHYGGRFSLADWVWPIPLAKGFVTAYKQNIGRPLDIVNERYQPFSEAMINVLEGYNSLIYASAHEKNIQIMKNDENFFINSGAPEKSDYLPNSPEIQYASSQPGIISVNYYDDGQISSFIIHNSESGFTIDETILFQSQCSPKNRAQMENHRLVPCNNQDKELNTPLPNKGKYVEAVAGPEYKKGPTHQFFFGKHYRSSWTTTVAVPYLNMDTTFGGLKPYAVGGGRQTKSLKIKGGDGMEYVFRSVDKDPVKALPYELRGTVISSVLKDQTTTQQPYGAMAASVMLDELNILHARPRLYVMPDDAILSRFNDEFAGMLGMLEGKPVNPKSVDSVFAGGDEVERSLRMFRELYEDNDNAIAVDEFLEARMFDLFVGDWGKHEDNWKWIGFEKEKGTLYRPFPRDRDHIFSRWDGFFPWLADREWAIPGGENFGYKIKGLRSLMWPARHLDRPLTNEATKEDWVIAAEKIQTNITDEVIENAIHNMPEEIYKPDGEEIVSKLKARKKDLKKYAEEYYLMLAKKVDIIGSEKDEYFDVQRNDDGTVVVGMYKEKDKKRAKQLYQRKFYPNETKEIRVFGLDEEDIFNIHGKTKKSILIRIIPGPAKDSIFDKSVVSGLGKKTRIYESDENERYTLGREAKRTQSKNPNAYIYDRTAFTYNTYLPLAYVSYNVDNGLALNAGIKFTNQKYGKPDFSSTHFINTSFSTIGNFALEYQGRWRYVFGKWDVFLNGLAGLPYDLNYYFGRGNDTSKDENLLDDDFYDVQHNTYRASTGIVRNFLKFSQVKLGIGYENTSEQLKENNLFTALPPLESSHLPGTDNQSFIISNFLLDLDFRDQPNLSRRGMRFFANYENGNYLKNTDYDDFGLAVGSIEQFISNYWNNPLTLGLKIGGSTSFGDVPYYHLKYLGQKNDLRGFRKNRFTGESTAFINSELRVQLIKTKTKVLPIKFGLKAFLDSGRVFDDNDLTDDWHTGYGAGFYLVPLREQFSLNVSVGFSEEESALILFSLGNVFN